MKFATCVAGLLCIFSIATAQQQQLSNSGYALNIKSLCDGYPKINVNTIDQLCVGLVAGRNQGLKMPRYAIQAKDKTIYITEMGSWGYNTGTVYALELLSSGKIRLTDLFPKRLTMPNGIVVDPEGRVYIGTPTEIFRFSPRKVDGSLNINPAKETVFKKFGESIFRSGEYVSADTYTGMKVSNKHKHPLIQMAVNANFTEMYINLGAPSDDCASGIQTVDSYGQCVQSEAKMPSASVWKIDFSEQRKVVGYRYFARGLRNSMALAVHAKSGTILQGENSLDLPYEDKPYEEINVLKEGQHYGWPYCHSRGEVAPFFSKSVKSQDCRTNFAMPQIFMPAHTAPLGFLYYDGGLSILKDKLLVSWHGYRLYGQRVVAYKVNNDGVPADEKYEEVISGWSAKPGIRPRGAPTGLLELQDGSILVLDDKNGAVLRLAEGSSGFNDSQKNNDFLDAAVIASFRPLIPFLKKNCASCHSEFKAKTDEEILSNTSRGMLNRKSPRESELYVRIKKRTMPPPSALKALKLTDKEYQEFMPKLEAFISTLK